MGTWVWTMVFCLEREQWGQSPCRSWCMAQGSRGPELSNRGQRLLWTGEMGAKQGNRVALGAVTRAKHSLVIARQVQGQGRMSVGKSRSGSAGPWPGTGMAAKQQELQLRSESQVQLESSSHGKVLPGALCQRPPKEEGCLYVGLSANSQTSRTFLCTCPSGYLNIWLLNPCRRRLRVILQSIMQAEAA